MAPAPAYQVVIHLNENFAGYWAECVSLPGCFTDGDFIDDTKKNMYEAVNLILKDDFPHIKDYSLVFDIAE